MTSYDLFELVRGFPRAPGSLPGCRIAPISGSSACRVGYLCNNQEVTLEWTSSVSACRSDTRQPADTPAAPPPRRPAAAQSPPENQPLPTITCMQVQHQPRPALYLPHTVTYDPLLHTRRDCCLSTIHVDAVWLPVEAGEVHELCVEGG